MGWTLGVAQAPMNSSAAKPRSQVQVRVVMGLSPRTGAGLFAAEGLVAVVFGVGCPRPRVGCVLGEELSDAGAGRCEHGALNDLDETRLVRSRALPVRKELELARVLSHPGSQPLSI